MHTQGQGSKRQGQGSKKQIPKNMYLHMVHIRILLYYNTSVDMTHHYCAHSSLILSLINILERKQSFPVSPASDASDAGRLRHATIMNLDEAGDGPGMGWVLDGVQFALKFLDSNTYQFIWGTPSISLPVDSHLQRLQLICPKHDFVTTSRWNATKDATLGSIDSLSACVCRRLCEF